MLDERNDVADNEPIEEVDNMQIGDVVVDRVEYQGCYKCFSDVLSVCLDAWCHSYLVYFHPLLIQVLLFPIPNHISVIHIGVTN